METIYVDSLFFINLAVNYVILLASAKIGAASIHRIRFAVSAALGAAYSVLLVMPLPDFLASVPLKLALSVLMILVAFGGEDRFIRITICFYAVSAAFGGTVFAVSMFAGVPAGPISARVLALSFAISYAVLTLVFRRAAKRPERILHRIELEYNGSKAIFTALLDTGNSLHDPISGFSVIVVQRESLLPLFPDNITSILLSGGRTAAEEFELITASGGGQWRLIPYMAVGVEMGMLLAFRPDSIIIDGKKKSGYLTAVSPTRLSEDGEYSAVLSI